jgi:hypothetical protein
VLLSTAGPARRLVDDGPAIYPDKPRIEVEGVRWVVRGRIARGESSDVFLGCTDRRLNESVVIKLLRNECDADLFQAEWEALTALNASDAQGSPYFSTLIPQPIVHGMVRGSPARRASVFRFRPGFVHTLADVRRAHPDGVSPTAGVWMWKRLLELLGWAHGAGFTHGAVLPHHVLVQPRDHGIGLVGWSCAGRLARPAPLRATVAAAKEFYPSSASGRLQANAALDLAMVARTVVAVLGGDPARALPPPSFPSGLAALLTASATLDPLSQVDAWALQSEVTLAARAALGPPRFEPLSMPGWH